MEETDEQEVLQTFTDAIQAVIINLDALSDAVIYFSSAGMGKANNFKIELARDLVNDVLADMDSYKNLKFGKGENTDILQTS